MDRAGTVSEYEYIGPIGFSYYARASTLSVEFYQTLINRCWRRSGKLLYRPNPRQACCPHYTLRLDSQEFKPSRDQRQTINRFNKYIIGDSYTKEAARLFPRSKEETKKRNNEFHLTERLHEAEFDRLQNPPEPAHRLTVTLEENDFTEEKYVVFENYQSIVHKEKGEDISRRSFERFLCASPLRRKTVVGQDGRRRHLGSYHQCYRIDGVLVAVGVLDLLPDCVSSVYFFYHESIHRHAPGKLGALYEISLALEEGYRWWYPGFYIHNCPKMRYKIDFSPQYILDPVALNWDRLDATVLSLLNQKPFVSLSMERQAAASRPPGEDDMDTTDDARVIQENSLDGSDEDVEDRLPLLRSDMPGIPSLAEMEKVDLDHIGIALYEGLSPWFKTSETSRWHAQSVRDWPSFKAAIAELAAALGPDLVGSFCIDLRPKCGKSSTNLGKALRALRMILKGVMPTSSKISRRASLDGRATTMASQMNLFSPAELAYLHKSLSQRPPIRPDGRGATQFRPLTAETGILPGCNGSARVCFSDGTEAVVGVKAELEKTIDDGNGGGGGEDDSREGARDGWLELSIEIPGQRDDEPATVFLSEMLREALVSDGEFAKKLWINRRFHWRMYLDILLVSPPLSYPVPLLSITSHLALLSTRLPLLRSEGDEDPMFDDDWEASTFLYPRDGSSRPPVTLVVISVSGNIIFDPAKEELAVAEVVLALSVSEARTTEAVGDMDVDSDAELRLLSLRTIDPPSRLTPPGVPNSAALTANGVPAAKVPDRLGPPEEGVWRAHVGGVKPAVIDGIIRAVLEKDGVSREVLDALKAIDLA
ncbi:hypothetical protein L249_6092 [Ophiocordyceps polyrhachis-furcata BCC 54312]|uniref:arginyltransferase n=1 Tax=Ophiocordyceps polyrhachis-furcata BCC 54312 TaxID=1330021 RepID=A0A367LJ99_9HYPO|nr:hypothetical protein L249_6092 [Ophiocordyceps polyrhachis-furcata BCC 54312]